MHKNIFPLFITFLGIATAYVFYAVWHTEETPFGDSITQTSKEISQTETIDQSYKKSLPSKNSTVKTTSTLTTTHHKTINKKEPNVYSVSSETPEETQEVYEALVPESYDDTVAEAQEAFSSLDETVLEIQDRLDIPMMEIDEEE